MRAEVREQLAQVRELTGHEGGVCCERCGAVGGSG